MAYRFSTLRRIRLRSRVTATGQGEEEEEEGKIMKVKMKMITMGSLAKASDLRDSPSPTGIGEFQAPGLVSPRRRGGFHMDVDREKKS
jgi:hypothetical protein